MSLAQRLVTGVAAFGLVGGITACAAGPAEAATPRSADACVFVDGTTSDSGTNTHGLPTVTGGTAFTKPSSSSCHDFNLWSGTVDVSYEGWLKGSDGDWTECTEGNVEYTGSPIVLCSDVASGTVEAVTDIVNRSGLSVEIED